MRRGLGVTAAATGMLLMFPQAAAAGVPPGTVEIKWSLDGLAMPAKQHHHGGGFADITFPITVNRATAHKESIFAEQTYRFQNNLTGWIGLQLRKNKNGKERMLAVFSLAGKGVKSTDPNCVNDHHGGPGVTCRVEFNAVYGHKYDLTAKTTVDGNLWTGTVRDTVTGSTVRIGTYETPAGSGGLKGDGMGHVQFYAGTESCPTLPRADVVFGGPTTTAAIGERSGTSKAVREYDGCVGKSNYKAKQIGSDAHVTRGFIGTDDGGESKASQKPIPPEDEPTTKPAPGKPGGGKDTEKPGKPGEGENKDGKKPGDDGSNDKDGKKPGDDSTEAGAPGGSDSSGDAAEDDLAKTGASVGPTIGFGAAALALAGGGILFFAKRRRRTN